MTRCDRGTADARYCEAIVRSHARTFALASRLLPAEKRRAAYALYAFCREADDLVDLAPSSRRAAITAELARYQVRLDKALAGDADGPVFREVARVVREYTIPGAPLHELLDGVAADLTVSSFETWAELELYCQGVASSVGEMCTHVFGVPGGETVRTAAVSHARTLGVGASACSSAMLRPARSRALADMQKS